MHAPIDGAMSAMKASSIFGARDQIASRELFFAQADRRVNYLTSLVEEHAQWELITNGFGAALFSRFRQRNQTQNIRAGPRKEVASNDSHLFGSISHTVVSTCHCISLSIRF